jgi:hypothetical protein
MLTKGQHGSRAGIDRNLPEEIIFAGGAAKCSFGARFYPM